MKEGRIRKGNDYPTSPPPLTTIKMTTHDARRLVPRGLAGWLAGNPCETIQLARGERRGEQGEQVEGM